jgi:transcriptional regulator with XRE-family HTH domain
MKERLVQLLDLEQLTPSKFADIIGVQRSSVSHVISGRNNPSFDFLQKTLKAFPGLNAEWLMLGKGTMYEQMGRAASGTLFDAPVKQPDTIEEARPEMQDSIEESAIQEEPHLEPALERIADAAREATVNKGDSPQIISIVLLYSDGTFSSFDPS